MDVDRAAVVDALRRAGYAGAADEVLLSFQERIDRSELVNLVSRYGIHSLDDLISRMGGSS